MLFKNFNGCLVNFLAQIVTRGNAVQICSNFPAKRLSVYIARNFVTPFN